MHNHILFQDKPIHYRSTGNGPTLVLLHGFLESLAIWNDFEEQLSKTFHVVCIDLPGHGKSAVLGKVQPMELMADAVKAVLDHLKVHNCVMAGHSMGGYVCLAFAHEYPQLLKGFCMFNSTTLEDNPEKKKDRVRAVKVIQMNPEVFINEAIPNLFAPGNLKRFNTDVQRIKKEALLTPTEGINSSLLGMKDRPDRLGFIGEFPKPILFIVGKKDPIMPFEKMKGQINAAPTIEAVILENVGHMGFIEAKEETLEVLENFAVKCHQLS